MLPNNKNIVLTAEQAAAMSERPVEVVPTRSMPAGLAAMIAFDPQLPARGERRRHGARPRRACAAPRSPLRCATPRSTASAVREGQVLGLVDGRLLASGDDLGKVFAAILAEFARRRRRSGDRARPRSTAPRSTVAELEAVADEALSRGRDRVPRRRTTPVSDPGRCRMTMLTLDNTAIVADSTCDPPPGLLRRARTCVWSRSRSTSATRPIATGSTSRQTQFFDKLAESPMSCRPRPSRRWPSSTPATASFARATSMSSRCTSPNCMSGTFEAASTAARAHDGVEVYRHARRSSTVVTLLDRSPAGAARTGHRARRASRLHRELPRTRSGLVFQVATLEYLRRGGRIGRASRMVGDILGIRPLLHCAGRERDRLRQSARRTQGARAR